MDLVRDQRICSHSQEIGYDVHMPATRKPLSWYPADAANDKELCLLCLSSHSLVSNSPLPPVLELETLHVSPSSCLLLDPVFRVPKNSSLTSHSDKYAALRHYFDEQRITAMVNKQIFQITNQSIVSHCYLV